MSDGIVTVSKPVPITTGTSVRNKKTNYYVSEVTSLGDGSLKRETFRSDAQGNNRVLVQTTISDKTGKVTNTTTGTGATTEEKRAFKNPNSQLRNGIRTTTKDAGDVVQKNEADAAAGGLTDAGKKNQEIIAGGSGNSASEADDGTSQPSWTWVRKRKSKCPWSICSLKISNRHCTNNSRCS